MNDNTRNGANVVPARRPLTRRGFIQLSGGVLAAGAGASALAACGSSGSSAGSTAAGASSAATGGGASGKTQLTLMSWEQFEIGEKAAWYKVIDDFEAANPNITVSWTGWPFATYDQNVVTQAEAGASTPTWSCARPSWPRP